MEIIILLLLLVIGILLYLSYNLYTMVYQKEFKKAKDNEYAPVSILRENNEMIELLYTSKPSEIFKGMFQEGDIGPNGQRTTV